MFRKKTVFVVGAGGSVDFGLPTGAGLKKSIQEKLNVDFESFLPTLGSHVIARALSNRYGSAPNGSEIIGQHLMAAKSISNAMPISISIDNFIHTHSADERIVKMGKMAIVECILDAERNSKLFEASRDDGTIDFAELPEHWLGEFCRILTEDVTLKETERLFDNVSIITFNYDRCIEFYIPKWLSLYYRIDETDAEALTQRLNIIHPYGQSGLLPWQTPSPGSICFGRGAEISRIEGISEQIRTFTEQIRDESVPELITNTLTSETNIIFLGSSFARMNMSLLQARKNEYSRYVYGTRLGISDANVKSAKGDIRTELKVDPFDAYIDLVNIKSATMLQEYSRVLSSR